VREPLDLPDHAGIIAPSQASPGHWSLERREEHVAVRPKWCCRVSSLKLAADIATSGAGIAMIPAFVALEGIKEGVLVQVLAELRGGVSDIHIVHQSADW
jgi:DNA-binding transcriptional LysR family regulator